MNNSPLERTAQTRLRRRPDRGSYDRAKAYAILDEALYCQVGFVVEAQPMVIPMFHARWEDRLLLHGAPATRPLTGGGGLCVTVTLLDGLVLARSAMHHSLNYRSVVLLGQGTELTDPNEKREALRRLVEHVLPGRAEGCRPPNAAELRATRVLALPIEKASVKVREGGPMEEPEDLELPYWAGVVPIKVCALEPIPDPIHSPRGPLPAGLAGLANAPSARGLRG